jgi:hypothetical protein
MGGLTGCSSHPSGTTAPEGRLKLSRLLDAYKTYLDRNNQRPPPDEKTFRAFLEKQPPEEKKALDLPENLDDLFTNPRDGQKFEVKWGAKPDPLVTNRALMWEKNGVNGMRFVALANGYIESFDEQRFNELKK